MTFHFILVTLICILCFTHISDCAKEHPDLLAPFDVLNDNGIEHRKHEYNTIAEEEAVFPNCTVYLTDQDFVLLKNRSLFVPERNEVYDYGSYFIGNGTAYFCGEELPQIATTQSYNYSEEFLHCGHVLISPEEYSLLKNGSIYIEVYSKSYTPLNYLLVDQGVYICLPSFEELAQDKEVPDDWHKFSVAYDYVTFTGLLISIISLLSHLTIFCLVPSVRNLPGSCLASLSFSLLIAYICFLTTFLIESGEPCAAIGICVYYFFLTSFFWMNAISFDVWRSFRVVMRELRISSHRLPWRRFCCYSLYCWATPAALAVMVKVFDTIDILPEDFRPSFGHPFCWFGQRKALLVFFAVPLIVVMLFNVFFFADVIYVINRATMKTATAHDANLKKSFVMFTRLALIMGLTWVFGIAAAFADQPVLWYIFIVLNTLQGLFIFAVFLGSSKVRGLCFKKYKNKGKRYSTSVRTVSAAF